MSNNIAKSATGDIPAQLTNPEAQTTVVDTIYRNAQYEERRQVLDSWYYLILSYLTTSKVAFEKIKSENLESNRLLILPSIYNLKHSIEIILKYLCISNKIDFDWSHDIEILIKQLWGTKKMTKEGKKLLKKDKPEEYIAFESILNLASKYATLEFLTSKLGAFQLRDGKNDIFRYPNSQASIKRIDYGLFVSNIELADINNIYDDLVELESAITTLKSYFVDEDIG